jgi:hypothetical protein
VIRLATYARIPYDADGLVYERKKAMFTPREYDIPIIARPITPLENFMRAWKHHSPVWAPIAMLDFDTVRLGRGAGPGPALGGQDRIEYTDEWGCQWVYVPEVGGSMLKPGTQLLDDITKWETVVKFPDWKALDWEGPAEEFAQNRKSPDRAVTIDIGTGCTEKLVAIMGGYTEAMIAMAEEQDAVLDFLNAYADSVLERYDLVRKYYPMVNMITIHDDWGSERDTFFSEAYFEKMVWQPTKKIIDHIKASGDICFELHSCGKIERFVPYMLDLKIDMLQIQRRANDMPALKEKYGDKIGFCCSIEGADMNEEMPKEKRIEAVRRTIELYGRSGGLYIVPGAPPDNAAMWDICSEAYGYSREFYDRERGDA